MDPNRELKWGSRDLSRSRGLQPHTAHFTIKLYWTYLNFTRTLHILLPSDVQYFYSFQTYITYFTLFRHTLHILLPSDVQYIFYSHCSFNALTLFFHLPYLCHHSINLKFTSLPNKHHACFSYILYLHFLHLTLPKHINWMYYSNAILNVLFNCNIEIFAGLSC